VQPLPMPLKSKQPLVSRSLHFLKFSEAGFTECSPNVSDVLGTGRLPKVEGAGYPWNIKVLNFE